MYILLTIYELLNVCIDIYIYTYVIHLYLYEQYIIHICMRVVCKIITKT